MLAEAQGRRAIVEAVNAIVTETFNQKAVLSRPETLLEAITQMLKLADKIASIKTRHLGGMNGLPVSISLLCKFFRPRFASGCFRNAGQTLYAASSRDVSDSISPIRGMTTNSAPLQNWVVCGVVAEIVPAGG